MNAQEYIDKRIAEGCAEFDRQLHYGPPVISAEMMAEQRERNREWSELLDTVEMKPVTKAECSCGWFAAPVVGTPIHRIMRADCPQHGVENKQP